MRPILPILMSLLVACSALAAEPPAADRPDADDDAAVSTGTTGADDAPVADGKPAADGGPKTISGMSILGNQEAPKSLVIVPWKSSEIGDSLGISAMLDEGRQPVDRDVFLRSLTYYEIRSEGPSTTDVRARRDR